MKKMNSTSLRLLMWMLLPVALLFSVNVSAQTMACNDNVQVSVDPTPDGSCAVDLTADMVLEAPVAGTDYLIEVLQGPNVLFSGVNTVTFGASNYLGATLVTRVTDIASGNKCWGSIHLEDKAAPVVNCNEVEIPCTQDYNNIAFPDADDNCDLFPEVQQIDEIVDASGQCSNNTVTIERVFIAIDDSGNQSAPCSQFIFIQRVTDVDFPNDIQWECDQEEQYPEITAAEALHPSVAALQVGNNLIDATVITSGSVLSNTGSGVPSTLAGEYCNYAVSHSDAVVDACGDTYKIIRTWTVLDWCTGGIITSNNAGEDNIQVVKIVDVTPPVITMNPYSVSANNPGVHPHPCTSTDLLPPANVSDNCHDVTVRIFTPVGEAIYINGVDGSNGGLIPSPGLELGTYQINYQAEDECGNISELFVTVEVVDDIVPTTICDEITDVALSSDGMAIVPADVFDDGSYDNCCLDEFLVRRMDGDCDGNFDDFGPTVKFCCEDIPNNNIMVVFRAVDCYGNFNDCMVEVEVEDKLPPSIVCPADVDISCDEYLEELDAAIQAGDYSLLEQFGDATYYDNCEPIDEYTVGVNINSCAEGTITRTWEITDPSGNTPASCTQTINVFHVSDWVVEFPDDIDAVCTDGDLPEFGEPAIFHDECELVGSSYEDQYFYIVPDACYKIVRTWTVINWCVYDDYGYDVWEEDDFAECDLFQDWDGDGDRDCRTFRDGWNTSGTPGTPDGYIDYVQTIKVVDVEEPTFEIPEIDGCIVELDCDKDLVIPYPNITDVCSPSFEVDITGSFGVFNDVQGDITIDDVVPGTYNIYYTVTDNCGNQAYDDVTVVVEDCKKPTPYCKNGLVIELMQTGMVDTWASDLNDGSFDNCPGDLQYSFSSDVNDTGITFTCDDLGQNDVEIWVTDATGNQDFCQTFIIIQDNMFSCNGVSVAGLIQTEDNDGIQDVNVDVNGGLFSQVTPNTGSYNFNDLASGGDYSISAMLDADHGNGVTTYDIVLVTMHILGVQALDSPYKMIAADVNNSTSVTTLDVVLMRKVILNIESTFPNNTSWRFVDAAYQFPDQNNPWAAAFPEVLNYNNLDSDIDDGDFVGIKVGDVNGSAQANEFMTVQDRTNGTFTIEATDRAVVAGETFTVDFTAADAAVMGYQFTLNFNNSLNFVELNEGVAKVENFGTTLLEDGALTVSWNDAAARTFTADEVLFSLTFTANAATTVSEALTINSRYTAAEAYNATGAALDVNLEISGATASSFELYQNVPNPFKGETVIGFNLPQAGTATLKVVDMTGKVIAVVEAEFEAGYNAFELNAKNLPATGVVYYTLETADNTATKKMVIVK